MGKKGSRASKIMLLRHAEKPGKDNRLLGVTRRGEPSKESLEVRGWQRAGALAQLLAPANNRFPHSALATPHFLYASKPLRRKGSQRPLQTIMPLAEKLALKIDSDFQRSDLENMIEDVFSRKGVVLICWQREYIPEIAQLILGKSRIAPAEWPEDRFDLIWVFDLVRWPASYKFRQVPQQLLAGDLTRIIK